jgi:hypothetical protein
LCKFLGFSLHTLYFHQFQKWRKGKGRIEEERRRGIKRGKRRRTEGGEGGQREDKEDRGEGAGGEGEWEVKIRIFHPLACVENLRLRDICLVYWTLASFLPSASFLRGKKKEVRRKGGRGEKAKSEKRRRGKTNQFRKSKTNFSVVFGKR